MEVTADSWTPGGPAKYTIKLDRNGGQVTGRYTGVFRGHELEGGALGKVHPERKAIDGLNPVKPGEHPRILVRQSRLDALKERAETDFGRAAISRLRKRTSDPKALALRYALTGKVALAEKTIPLIKDLMKRGAMSDQYGNNAGVRLEATAVAYDLCRDAWPENFREKVEAYMFWLGRAMIHGQGAFGGGINWQADSNWATPNYMGLGYAGLALWGEPGPKPLKPRKPQAGAKIPPAKAYNPGEGVPVHMFEDDKMPTDWLYAGPFRPKGSDEGPLAGITGLRFTFEGEVRAPADEQAGPLADLNGVARARPERGTQVTFGGKTHRFHMLSHKKDEGYWEGQIDITNAADRELFSRNYFYCVIRNDEPRWVRADLNYGAGRMYLNGTPLEDGDSAHLEPGLYPVMASAPIGWMNSWGRHLMTPKLTQISREKAQDIARERKAEYKHRMARWKYDFEQWQRMDGRDVGYHKLARAGWLMNYLHYRGAMGTGGFQAELTHYSNIASGEAAKYAPAYEHVFAREVSPYDDVSHFLPRKIFAHAYPDSGKPKAQEINGKSSVEAGMFASLYPLVPEKWKRAILWGWHRHVAGTAEASPKKLLKGATLRTFLNYPLGTSIEHPRQSMPLTWSAPTLGFYAFRNAWSGADDFVAQVFLKAHPINGWSSGNAGTFRLRGLGHIWAHGPTDRNRVRWEENVVMLPQDTDLFTSALGKLIHADFQNDGSGVVSIDMNDIYAKTKEGVPPYSDYGGVRNPEAFVDSGISGMRSIGVDYSNESGAPCLLVVVDRIHGGGKKIWTWQLATSTESGTGDLSNASANGDTFTIDKGDATLRGKFIAPNDVKLFAEQREKTMIGRAGSPAGETLDRPISGIFAEGGDVFFAVITLQRGTPPPIRVEGSGLDATVRVGNQSVRFDDRKIRFGNDH